MLRFANLASLIIEHPAADDDDDNDGDEDDDDS